MQGIKIAAVIIAMGYASSVQAEDIPKKSGSSTAPQTTKSEDKNKTGSKKTTEKSTDTRIERERKADTPPAKSTTAPNMQPTDPLNPDPMRPGTPPTFPRNESSPQTPVKPTDPTAPTAVK